MDNVSILVQKESIEALQSAIRKSEKAMTQMKGKDANTTLLDKRLRALQTGLNLLENIWHQKPVEYTPDELLGARAVLEGLFPSLESIYTKSKPGSPQRTLMERRMRALKLVIQAINDNTEILAEKGGKVMKKEKLTILWTTDNEDTALNMILMYTLKANENKWWKECNLITWGPSNKLLCQSQEVQDLLKQIMATGVKVYACQRCAERYGLVDQIKEMGIEVKLMGEPLTQYLQDDSCQVLSI